MSGEAVLVVNSGSSSIKLTLFDLKLNRLADAHLKKQSSGYQLQIQFPGGNEFLELPENKNPSGLLPKIFDLFKDKGLFINLKGIGHRFVHGGWKYTASTTIDEQVLAELKSLSYLAPLHNEFCLAGIQACRSYFGNKIVQIAVFDTAFHHTIPDYAANYAIDYKLQEKYRIKRYGFHGISHAFLWETYLKNGVGVGAQSKIITVHLGNGCSITAINGGKSMETSMGFTPAEGLIMATRAGDIDAAIVPFLCEHEHESPAKILELLNFESGLLGISGVSSLMHKLIEIKDQNKRAKLAIDMFCHRIVKYLGGYLAILQGAEAILFSGGIGENAPYIRQKIANSFAWLGVKIDDKANESAVDLAPGTFIKINAGRSLPALYVVATDENNAIAHEILTFL